MSKPDLQHDDAAAVIVREMAGRSPDQVDTFVREMLVYAAWNLALMHGRRLAVEAVYAVGDRLLVGDA